MSDIQWMFILFGITYVFLFIIYGTVDTLYSYKFRQRYAKKPLDIKRWRDEYVGDCPECKRVVRFAQKYCHNCTQRLDWQDVVDYGETKND